MRQRSISHCLARMMTSASHRTAIVAAIGVFVQLASAVPARASVTLTASRTSMLYSSSAGPDCSELSKAMDAALPFNVTRLRVTVVGAPAGQSLSY